MYALAKVENAISGHGRTLKPLTFRSLLEAPNSGRLKGAQANKDKAAKFREAIIQLAQKVWAKNPAIQYNLLETAREIEKKHDAALRLGSRFDYLGVDAIRKHLSRLRKEGYL
jgi:hypothetical protein